MENWCEFKNVVKEKNAAWYGIFNGLGDHSIGFALQLIFLTPAGLHVLKSHVPQIKRGISSVTVLVEEHSQMVQNAIFFGCLLTQVVTADLYEPAIEVWAGHV